MLKLISKRSEKVIRTDVHQPRHGFTKNSSKLFINKIEIPFYKSIVYSHSISSNKLSAKWLTDLVHIAKLKFGRLFGEYRIWSKADWLFY